MERRDAASGTVTVTEADQDPPRVKRYPRLIDLTPSDATPSVIQSCVDSWKSVDVRDDRNDVTDDASGVLEDALRLLSEPTFALDWKSRSLLGELVVLVCQRVQSLKSRARDSLREIVSSRFGSQMTREQYYPDLVRSEKTSGLETLSTEGWGSLEVAMLALRELHDSEACWDKGERERTVGLAVRGVRHPNRHVRQVSWMTVGEVCRRAVESGRTEDAVGTLTECGVFELVREGLTDDWAQVRYATAHATRSLLDLCPNVERSPKLPDMLAALFVSRHDAAEGVRLLAQVNWRRAVNLSGKQLLAKHVSKAVELLCSEAMTRTHELQSAACVAAGELAVAVSQRAVAPHAPALLSLLHGSLEHPHWAVRMAACNAVHDFAGAFPRVVSSRQGEILASLLHLCGDDSISGVREASAAALGAWARALPEDQRNGSGRASLLEAARGLLEAIRQEPVPEGGSRESVCSEAARQAHFNSTAVHTAQETFGCCSLEPHHDRGQPPHAGHPWQRVTGGVYLSREVAHLWPDEEVAGVLLPLLDEVFRSRWFVHFTNVQAVLQQQLHCILEGLGDRSRPFLGLPLLALPPKK